MYAKVANFCIQVIANRYIDYWFLSYKNPQIKLLYRTRKKNNPGEKDDEAGGVLIKYKRVRGVSLQNFFFYYFI